MNVRQDMEHFVTDKRMGCKGRDHPDERDAAVSDG